MSDTDGASLMIWLVAIGAFGVGLYIARGPSEALYLVGFLLTVTAVAVGLGGAMDREEENEED